MNGTSMSGSDKSGMEDSNLLTMRYCIGHIFYPDLSKLLSVPTLLMRAGFIIIKEK